MTVWGGPQEPEFPVGDDERPWAIIASLSSMFCAIIGPLIIYLVKKDTSPFAERVAAHVLAYNLGLFGLQLVMMAFFFLGMIAMAIIAPIVQKDGDMAWLMAIPIGLIAIAYIALIVTGIASLVLSVIGTVFVATGKVYRYPFVHRFVK